MTDVKAPERIWADQDNLTWVESNPDERQRDCEIIYIRKDLHDALAKERDELQAEIARLTAERDQALTQVAAAYEAAAKLSEASAERNKTCPSGCRCADGWHIAMRIRNLTPADAQAALDKLLARAREDAIREAAELAAAGHHPRAILALLNDGEDDGKTT